MTELEEIVATAEAYQRLKDLLSMEQLILAAMPPRSPSGPFEAQHARVIAISNAIAVLARNLPPHPETVREEGSKP